MSEKGRARLGAHMKRERRGDSNLLRFHEKGEEKGLDTGVKERNGKTFRSHPEGSLRTNPCGEEEKKKRAPEAFVQGKQEASCVKEGTP